MLIVDKIEKGNRPQIHDKNIVIRGQTSPLMGQIYTSVSVNRVMLYVVKLEL